MRDLIEKYLSTIVNSTAKKISLNIGMPQLDVAHALNKMHADGLVEREKRPGGGNEYTYWLAAAKRDAGVNTTTGTSCFAPTVATAPAVVVKAPQAIADRREDAVTRSPDDEMLITDLSEKARLLRAVLDVLGLPQSLDDVVDAAVNMRREHETLRTQFASIADLNERLKANNAQLEQRIDSLSGDVRPVGSVFVTIGRDAKPMRHASIEKAQKRGRALVSGNRETEVLVLEPIGRIVRGAEWRPRQP
ncbi:1-pyrroline-5-carboxylate dehydrogenase [Burkholderia vietnamiensis]|uniref:1-pyrroline-5-carboxylate dehydrogenase n=1 Tax=Burkholderia vietnamiensis TaxID=60552 RepID=UPI001041A46F|nr:1-pyrroline-5-carboxylate dehydrogenase [Burkholderia vietnamiensis]